MLGTARFGAALSRHADPATATGEVLGQLLDATGPAPDLAVLFASPHHLDALDDVVDACTTLLAPGTLLGAIAGGVLAGAELAEEGPALALWAGRIGPVAPLRLETLPGEPPIVAGLPDSLPAGSTVLALAEPTSFDADGLIRALDATGTVLHLAGGLASAGRRRGQDRLVLDDAVHRGGAVAAVVPPDVGTTAVVSQGCRPIGDPWVVTASEGRLLLELAGRPALERIGEVLASLDPVERQLAARGLHLGVVAREQGVEDFGPGDFCIRRVLGADPPRAAVAVGQVVDVGQVVQLQVRDARSADADLHRALHGVTGSGALLFSCSDRGSNLFGRADHDAAVVSEALVAPLAGMSCAGELGPVGARNAVHGFAASVLVFA